MSALIGHDAQIAHFHEVAGGPRAHHAWLLTGPRGLGKGMFARAAATWLLANAAGPPTPPGSFEVPASHPVAALIAAGSHPDLRILERLPRDGGELARSITVDQVRGLSRMSATTPALSGRRVVILDPVDDLEREGANALLKSLEEPPAGTVFLLVSHRPGGLLPTIRSRCRTLRFGPLAPEAMAAFVARALPPMPPEEARALVALADGAPGAALRYAGLQVAELDRDLATLAREGDPRGARRSALAASLASKKAQARYELFLERVPRLIAGEARGRRGTALADALALWEKARDLGGSATRLSLDPQTTIFELAGLVAALAPESAAHPDG